MLRGLMPSARQAVSSSRSASQARLMGRRRRREREEIGDEREDQDDEIEEEHPLVRRIGDIEELGEGLTPRRARSRSNSRPKKAGPRHVVDAVGAAGEPPPVGEDDADHLAETEGDDGEIVAAQPQYREAQHDAEARGERAGDRQRDPEAEIEMGREHRIAVGADRIEGDVAEIEQAGETDHDVEAPSQHDVGQHQGRHIDEAPVGKGHEGKADGEHDQDQAEDLVVSQIEAGEAVLAGVGLGSAGLGLRPEREKERAQHQRQRHQHHAPIDHPGIRRAADRPAAGPRLSPIRARRRAAIMARLTTSGTRVRPAFSISIRK